ncbi:MAG TPA: CcdB family protein [Aliidiomarina sp.]|nr:CcdB family protein [Aliidiomarina sp.]
MAKFSIYQSPSGNGFLLDVQSDLLSGLNTRMVVPLLERAHAPTPAQRLNPVFIVDGVEVVMATQFMAAIPKVELKHRVGQLKEEQHEASNALDMLFLGF